jgi:hypothetical protein
MPPPFCVARLEADRRAFLRSGCLAAFGLTLRQWRGLASWAAAEDRGAAAAQSVILLWLDGGPSQVDTWDPKPNSSFKPISTNVPGIQISELLPRVSQRMDKLSIIRSMRSEENNHGTGTYYALTGHRRSPAMKFSSVGSIISKELGSIRQMPPNLVIPGWHAAQAPNYHEALESAYLGAAYSPMFLDPTDPEFRLSDLVLPASMSTERLTKRRSLLAITDRKFRIQSPRQDFTDMDQLMENASKMVTSSEVQAAFDLSQETEATRDAYGRNGVGKAALLARRLVEAGARFVTARGHRDNAWDTHSKNDDGHKKDLTPPFDQALSALVEDLSQRGLWGATIVVAMGEFGRTPFHNSAGGRDHWPNCWSLVLGGGGLRGGQVIGSSDERGGEVKERKTSIGDLFATVYKALGIDWRIEYPTPVGRPVKIANSFHDTTGTPIPELV